MTGPHISVASLLRREGRGPHTADRPLEPRAYERGPTGPARRNVRKVTAVVGALFAVGSILSTASLHEARPISRGTAEPDDALQPAGTGQATAVRNPADAARAGDGGGAGTGGRLSLAAMVSGFTEQAPGLEQQVDPVPAPASGGSISDLAFPATSTSAASEAPTKTAGAAPSVSADALVAVDVPAVAGGEAGPPVVAVGSGPVGGVSAEVTPPAVALPAVEVPSVQSPSSVKAPGAEVSDAGVSPPTVSAAVSPRRGLRVAASRAAVRTPDAVVTDATAGPVALSRAEVTLPDVTVGAVEVVLPAPAKAAAPVLEVPRVAVSETRLRLPNVTVGKTRSTTVETPDVSVPPVDLTRPLGAVTGILGGKGDRDQAS